VSSNAWVTAPAKPAESPLPTNSWSAESISAFHALFGDHPVGQRAHDRDALVGPVRERHGQVIRVERGVAVDAVGIDPFTGLKVS
jgi:hypothetical protein